MDSIVLNSEFGYVLLASAVISLQCTFSARDVGKLRREYKLEYPDTGNGRYAAKLTEDQWRKFNLAQRVHSNYVEHIGVIQPLLWSAGVLSPKYASILGATYIVGREVYGMGYQKSGPKGRLYGFGVWQLSTLGLVGITVHGALKLLKYI